MHSEQDSVLTLRRSCVKLVHALRIPTGLSQKLSTDSLQPHRTQWMNNQVTHRPLHTFSMQFYPNKNGQLTEATSRLSPLSTPLIIKTAWLKKENLLIGNGG
jgi:hypothetical protein